MVYWHFAWPVVGAHCIESCVATGMMCGLHFKVTGYRGGVVFLSTSTASSYGTVALPKLKTTQYEVSHTGKHYKRREIHNSRGCGVKEAATTRFFLSEI